MSPSSVHPGLWMSEICSPATPGTATRGHSFAGGFRLAQDDHALSTKKKLDYDKRHPTYHTHRSSLFEDFSSIGLHPIPALPKAPGFTPLTTHFTTKASAAMARIHPDTQLSVGRRGTKVVIITDCARSQWMHKVTVSRSNTIWNYFQGASLQTWEATISAMQGND